MNDPRLQQLADTILDHSLKVKSGERVLISWDGPEAMPLIQTLISDVITRGALPLWYYDPENFLQRFLTNANEEQIKSFGEAQLQYLKTAQAFIGIRGNDNAFELQEVFPERLQWYGKHYRKPRFEYMSQIRWVAMRYPSSFMAQLAQVSTESFTDFYFKTVLIDYAKLREAMLPLKRLMEKTDEVRIVSPRTDLRFSIKNIPVIACDGTLNLPDGEVFTAPVRDSINGTILFNASTPYQGKAFQNIHLTFKEGKIVEARCDNNTKGLNDILNTDEGSRYVGEFAIAFHPWIRTPMNDALFDEKIAGSLHFALGKCYDEASNGNKSAIHWDIVHIQRKDFGGGEIYFDGKLIRKDGAFALSELQGLNPETWGAPAC
ncbi:MAG: hypothetical protein A3I05_00395 [Deltaproteobacteria bacterium RIFCSPLOWO2_02_FULL_44_10]|nr:MAG: hypothetical protein A3C46_01265 [Deltaproteobacteria bacterium RIFCSPHIGHO2_02_FULL_44_16]OGQ47265.1 MAG: hypothetical protein A3I05_00395 [Deltaproteobacteria bacterium RIFCSPLOWO2_02_FULL_44_10]